MKNFEIHSYRAKPICDLHMHLHVESPLEETVDVFTKVKDHFNYEKIALQAIPYFDKVDNEKALYLKSRISGLFADCGLHHNGDTKEYYEEQAKTMYACGCDGFKLFEGKPEYRKELGISLCDARYDKFYAFAEENALPVVMHFGDPREFWDIEKIPKWALERGWLYDESFVHFNAAQREVEGILEKFPKLHLILAHFFFVSDDIEYAGRFMERFENVCFDLTPGTEMFFNFNDKSEEWRAFFLKYADRILYGTDIYNWHQEDKTVEEKYSHAVNLVRSFLEYHEPFRDKWTNRDFAHPFGFEDNILDKIYHDNFVRLFGNTPRPLDQERIVFACRKAGEQYQLPPLEEENLKQIITEFK